MSDKDRQKKDHKRKDKENRAMSKAQGNPRKQQASPRHQAKDESNLTDSETRPDARMIRSPKGGKSE
jgi:hypothetical protein